MRRSPRTVRAASLAATVIAVGLLLGPARCQEIEASPEMQRRGHELLERLRHASQINVSVYGDSITAGWGTDGTHVYHRMFLDCLRYRFPDCAFECQVAGNPGWTTAAALRGLDRQVMESDPDLLLVQFGGNDRGWGRPLALFRSGLAQLLARASGATEALVVACLPPFAEEMGDNDWSAAGREVTAQAGIPSACFHRAIGEGPHDFRSSFPYGSHPGSFTHALMAKEVLRVFDTSTGAPRLLRCELARAATVSADPEYLVSAVLSTVADEAVAWSMRMEFGREVRDLQGTVAPDAPVTVSERFAIPEGLPAGKAYAIPARLWARAGDSGAFDVAWLTISPAIAARPDRAIPLADQDGPWHALGAQALVLGMHLWQGVDDLSGRFRVLLSQDHLRVEVEVVDDQVTVADLTDPARGDSVEFYIDLRTQEHQGQPVYTEDVLALQVVPPAETGAQVQWRNMHELPDDLSAIRVTGHLSAVGYGVVVELPLSAVKARRGEDWGGIGLDVGVNDADHGNRKTQMMWAGIADNYLNPGYLAGVYPGTLSDRATRRVFH